MRWYCAGAKLKLRLILRELRQKEVSGVTRLADNSAAPTVAPFPELDWTDLMGEVLGAARH